MSGACITALSPAWSLSMVVSVPLGAISSVWPSGTDFATDTAPVTVPPPSRFSMITGLPRRSASRGPNERAMMSMAPPAASGTTIVIGLVGNSCAVAGW
jgi:hypothetical protein